jgi:hypothetical protein
VSAPYSHRSSLIGTIPSAVVVACEGEHCCLVECRYCDKNVKCCDAGAGAGACAQVFVENTGIFDMYRRCGLVGLGAADLVVSALKIVSSWPFR